MSKAEGSLPKDLYHPRSSYNQDLSKHLREHLGATTEEQINVAGVVGLKGIVLSSGEIDSYIIIILPKRESLYQITARPMDSSKIDLFDLILQTFQFAEDETSGWKNYEHKVSKPLFKGIYPVLS